MKIKIGQKIRSQCLACSKEEIWEVESIADIKYSDGVFKTYNLRAIKHCISDTVRTSIKDCPETWQEYTPISMKPQKITIKS